MTEPPRPPGDGADASTPDATPPPPSAPPPPGGEAGPGYTQPGPGYAQPGPGYTQPGPGYGPPGPPPPPGGYPPGPGFPPPGYASSDDRTWALVAHFGGAAGMLFAGVLGFVGPLIALVGRGNQSPTVRAHAVAALNFQLLWSIIGFAALLIGCFLAFIPTLAVMVIGIIFGVIAGVKANEGQLYRYPMSATFIK